MLSRRIEEAERIIEETLQEVFQENISITNLLIKASAIARLLDIQRETDWIQYELKGYRKNEAEDKESKRPSGLPKYRELILIAELGRRTTATTRWNLYKPETPVELTFWITEPCSVLEKLNKLVLYRTIRRLGVALYHSYIMYSELDSSDIAGILDAVRGRIHDFLIEQKIFVSLGPLMEHILESTKTLVFSRFRELNSELFEALNRMLERQKDDTSSISWREGLDACRNVIQQFTEFLMTDDIITGDTQKPSEDDPVGKVSLLLDFAKSGLGKKKGSEEIKFITKGFDYFDLFFRALKARIEKTKHKPMTELEKEEADRMVAYVILWIADVIRLLDRAGFDWTKAKQY